MRLPSSRQKLLRNYQNAIFYNPKEPKKERMYVFYLLLKPSVDWLTESLINKYGLEKDEAESEIYLLCAELFNGFNKNKNSIVPYVEKYLPWKISRLIRKLDHQAKKEYLADQPIKENCYFQQEEHYWKIPSILTEERYVGNCFTRGEKYLIFKILSSDDNELDQKHLAESCGISRRNMILKLKDIKEVLINNWRQ
jgi:hypothetical protein